LATSFIRPFILMFSRPLSVKNTTQGSVSFACQNRTMIYNMYTVFISSPHSRQSWLCVSPSLNIWALRVVWPANSPTATWSFCLLIAWGPFVLLDTGLLIRVSDWRQPLQVFRLFWCSRLKWLLMTSLSTTKGMPTIWSGGTPLVPSLANLSAFYFPVFHDVRVSILRRLLYPIRFSSACIHPHTRANSVGVLQVLLLQPCCQRGNVFSFCLRS